jgi:GT2 family glycosyltransferase
MLRRWLHRWNARRLGARRARQAEQAYQALLARDRQATRGGRMNRQPEAQPLRITLICLPEGQDPWPLAARLDHLAGQDHPDWELLIDRWPADTPAATDPRCRCPHTPDSASLAERYNLLLAQATGSYVARLRDGDRLSSPHALRLWAEAAERFGAPAVLYADEDRVHRHGRHHSPHFKCGWNQELQRASHALGRAWLLRTDRARAAGGWPALPEPAASQWLVLAACGADPQPAPVHVPHLLWHWQTAQGPAPVAPGSPEQARAIHAVLQSHGVACSASPAVQAGLRLRYALPEPAPLVSLIVPTRNGLALLRQCVDSVLSRTRYPCYELLIVDNGSDDPATLAYLQAVVADPRVRVRVDPQPFNYAALNNQALPDCRGSVIGLLNNDTEVISPDWLEEMVGLACRRDVGAVGARLWYGNGTLQHAGVLLGLGGFAGHPHMGLPRGAQGYFGRACLAQEFSAVTAACLVMRRSVFDAVGGLDAQSLAVDLNDVDLCLKLRQRGLRVVWTPHAELFHHESASRGKVLQPDQLARQQREQQCFAARWAGWLTRDPAYNPNLALRRDAFVVDPQPRVDLRTPWWQTALPPQPPA